LEQLEEVKVLQAEELFSCGAHPPHFVEVMLKLPAAPCPSGEFTDI
jgi:hypothetical protein